MPDHAAVDDPEVITPIPIPRPEPVLDEARTAAAMQAILPLVSGVLVVTGLATQTEAEGLAVALVGVATGVIVIVNTVIGIWRARKARAVVTPLAAPVSAHGEQLLTLTAAEHLALAAAAREDVPEGTPEPTPWDEDTTVVRSSAA